jgi:hypothetical protein
MAAAALASLSRYSSPVSTSSMARQTLLAMPGFLSLWLRRIVPTAHRRDGFVGSLSG